MTKHSPPAAPKSPPPLLPSRTHYDVAHHPDEIAHRLHWEQMVDAGLIANRNPPPAPGVEATRMANDRLFRERARRKG